MELSRKTTILLSERLHEQLKRLARTRKRSVGELIRQACERQYHLASAQKARQAVEELAGLRLPVGSVAEMKRESVADPQDLP